VPYAFKKDMFDVENKLSTDLPRLHNANDTNQLIKKSTPLQTVSFQKFGAYFFLQHVQFEE